MRRDEVVSEAEFPLSIIANLSSSSSVSQTTQRTTLLPYFADDIHNFTDLVTTSNSSASDRQFFHSYDPDIGINTATFLGGLLLFLVVYVTYRTKCRKRLIKTLQKCSMKYFPEEFPPNEIITNQPGTQQQQQQQQQQSQGECVVKVKDAEWISERAKMIWQERALLSKDPDGIKCGADTAEQCVGNEENVNLESVECEVVREIGRVVDDGQCPVLEVPIGVHDVALQLPEVEEDIEQATAEWVRNVREMDSKERELNGIILKIPPDLVSHSAKIRSHFYSVTDYTNDFVRISVRNKSLPLLTEQPNMIYSTYARVETGTGSRTQNGFNYTPITTQDELLDRRPQQLQVQHQSGTKVPLDICPIVKVQHYHSRSKRRLTSLCRNSSEDYDSSSSSDDSRSELVQSLPRTLGQAKYIRLHTGEQQLSQDSDPIPFQTNTGIPNNVPKCFTKGNLETSL